MAPLSLRDVALQAGAIRRVVRRVAPWAVDPEELAARVRLELLERHARLPARRVARPWSAIRYVALEVARAEAIRVRRERQWPENGLAIADRPDLALERAAARVVEELSEDDEVGALEAMRLETPRERWERERATCRALCTIPAGLCEVVLGRV